MNNFDFDEIKIGQKEKFEKTITEEMMQSFGQICGDFNPLHTDRDYAISRGYKDKVVYGMLSASFYSTLVGMYIPGKKCLFEEAKISFNKPVYIGNKLLIEGIVKEKHELFKRITIQAKITQNNNTVSKAKLVVSGDWKNE